MPAPVILYIDTTNKRLINSFLATVQPFQATTLEAGDSVPVQLHFLQQNGAVQNQNALPYSYIDPSTVTPVSLAIGDIGLAPTGGTFTVSWNTSTSAALPYNVSASALQTAINGLSGIPSGGVTVVGNNGGPFTVTFNTAGAVSYQLVINASELVPLSQGFTAIAIAGASGVQEQEVLTLLQSPAALQNSWTPTYGAISVTRLQAGGAGLNEIQRVTVPAGTYAGSYSLAFGAKSTGALAYNISATALQTALAALTTIGANNINVVQSSTTTWDITFVGTLAGLSQSLIVATGTGLMMPMYLAANLNLNVQGIFNLLVGVSTDTATLQIQQGTSGNINTVVQTTVNLNATLIRGTPSIPNPADPWQTLSEVNALIAAAAYVLPAATTSALGGVKVPGAGNLLVDGAGNISVPLGSSSTFGVFKVDNTTINATAGVLTVVSTYALPPATTTTRGGVTVPAAGGLLVDGSGNISVPLATASTDGTVAVPTANGLSVAGGVLSMALATSSTAGTVIPDGTIITVASGAITVAKATAAAFGVVQTDGATIAVAAGVISARTATASVLGVVQPDGTIITVAAGVITVAKATSSAFGVVQVDGTTIVSVAGVISAANGSSGAQPTTKVGLAVVAGSATTFMRSDAAPQLDVSITPTWTGAHIFTGISGGIWTTTFGGGTTGTTIVDVTMNSGSGASTAPRLNFQTNGVLQGRITLGTTSGLTGPSTNDLCVLGIGSNLVWIGSNGIPALSASSTVVAIKPATAATSAGGGCFTAAGGASISGSGRVQAGTSGKFAAVGGTLFDHFVDAGNATTTETDLYSDSILGNTLTTNGDKIFAHYGLTLVASATATREIRIYFAGTVIYDSTALAVTSSGEVSFDVMIIRDSSTTIRYRIVPIADSGTTQLLTNVVVGKLTGLTLTSANILKITGQSAGTGASTNDIVAILGTVLYQPAV